jgi:flagellar biosynthesis protein FlhB
MAEGGEELDKSETATPFKLDRARRKGVVAKGTDLGYLSALLGLAIVVQLFGAQLLMSIQLVLRRSFTSIPMAQDSRWVLQLFGQEASTLVSLLIQPVAVVVAIAIVVEIIQIRGVVFSAAPLKPDFTRLNPAKGLKRLFSLRMLKELAKNLLKFVLYAGGTFLLLRNAITTSAMNASDGRRLGDEIVSVAGQLLLMFIVIAAAMAVLDQILARRGSCQSNANRSPLGTHRSRGEFSHAPRFCHSVHAAERRSL